MNGKRRKEGSVEAEGFSDFGIIIKHNFFFRVFEILHIYYEIFRCLVVRFQVLGERRVCVVCCVLCIISMYYDEILVKNTKYNVLYIENRRLRQPKIDINIDEKKAHGLFVR